MAISLILNNDLFSDYKIVGENNDTITISKINIFIGPNNSGKSRFIRALAQCPELFVYDEKFYSPIKEKIVYLEEQVKKILSDANWDIKDLYLFHRGIERNLLGLINSIEYYSDHIDSSINILHDLNQFNGQFYRIENESFKRQIDIHYGKQILQLCHDNSNFLVKYISEYKNNPKKSLYLPVLRGLRNFNISSGSPNVYLERTNQDYFGNKGSKIIVFTGLELYDSYKKLLLGDYQNRALARNFEFFLSLTFFQEKVVVIIPREGMDVVYVKIGDHEERPIYDLGDGIQNIICLLFPLFERIDQSINVFIEEPDLFMHAGYQRIFINTLLSRHEFRNMRFFITTHSNHLLDMTLDYNNITVHSLSNTAESIFEISKRSSADYELLEMLGVRNSSVFLSNCTIWVEGITDRIYLRKYLELYIKNSNDKPQVFNEDFHYSFVEYGGGNITHWSFLDDEDANHSNINIERLCGKLFLVTDSDSDENTEHSKSTKKSIRQKKLKETLNDRYYCLKAREIENIIPVSVIVKVVSDYEKNNEALDFKDFKEKYNPNNGLGDEIKTHVKGLIREGRYAEHSGTIKQKLNFAKRAVSYMNDMSFDELTEEAQELTKKIYEFIKKNN